ncbi:BTB/POZ domain-containing protein DOT3 [Linum grandiflorum]
MTHPYQNFLLPNNSYLNDSHSTLATNLHLSIYEGIRASTKPSSPPACKYMAESASASAGTRWWIQLPLQRSVFTITMDKSVPFSLPVDESQSSSSSSGSDPNDHVRPQQSIILPANSTIDALEKNAHNWPITSQLPTDLLVQVQDATFTVHKYPLVSKCGYIAHLELQPSISNISYEVKLESFPGGSETFEAVLRFCYGLPLDLNPQNIAPLRCASEYLEMSEELEDGNLITKTESFLTFVILSSWKDTITVLKSCEALSPWAENLQIVRRCCDSITWKASRANFNTGDAATSEDDAWWLDDVATLHINHFTRIITAIRAKGTKPEIIGKCIMRYASKWLSGVDEELKELRGYGQGKGHELQFSVLSGRKKDDEYIGHKEQQTTIIENLISLLPPQQEAVPCRFLLQMLNMATVYSASPALITQLEKRVGIILDKATVNDLLIPNYKTTDRGKLLKSPDKSTMHDIDTVQRIVEYFLMHEQDQQQIQSIPGKASVSKLLDNYLAEIAKDPNVSVTKFQVLAEALPESARACHDGLYRAIDIYLKTHPSLSEHDRKRVCRLMNCERLSVDACMHAAQNDRLPVRTVIQVLFTEQVKLRAAMQRKDSGGSGNISEQEVHQTETKSEIMTLKAELENVKTRMAELQKDYLELQHEYAKLNNKHKNTLAWGWKKIRTSSLFHRKVDEVEIDEGRQRSNSISQKLKSRKVDGVETEEGRQRSNSISQKLNLRRRMSV